MMMNAAVGPALKDGCESISSGQIDFAQLKQHLEGRRFHDNREVETTVREWLRM